MVVSKRKSLAGINGIPLEQDQYADSIVFGISSRPSDGANRTEKHPGNVQSLAHFHSSIA